MPELTNVNVQMRDGVHYLTAVNGGGQPPQPQNGLATNQPGPPGPSETFSVEVIDPEAGTFALGTPDGVHFVTATDEGGIGEKADPAGLQPLHTDQADPALWESLQHNSQSKYGSVDGDDPVLRRVLYHDQFG